MIGYGIFLLFFFFFKDFLLQFFKDNAAEVLDYTGLILLLIFFLIVITVLEYYSRSLLRIVVPNFLREVGIRLMQAILVSLYFTKLIDFQQLLIGSVLIYLIILVILVVYLAAYSGLRLNLNFISIPNVKIREILSFSALSFVGTSSAIIISKMDSLMVSGFEGFTSNAIYTTAFYIATVIEIPKRAITGTSTILISRAFEENNIKEVATIYHKTAINQSIAGFLLLLGVWANLNNLFTLIPKGDFFEAGMFVVLIIGGTKLIDMIFGPSSEIIVLSKYYWFNIIVVSVLAITGLILNYIFIPLYGITGAAYATAISIVVFNCIKYVFIYAKLGIHPFSGSFIKLLVISGIVVAINYFMLPEIKNVFIDIVYRSLVITIIFGSLILLSRTSEDVNRVVYGIFNRIKSKL